MAVIPVLPNASIPLKSVLEIPRTPTTLSNIISGEDVSVRVIEKLEGNTYLISLKDTLLNAKSDIPLKPGDTLGARVSSLVPQILLTLSDPQKQNMDAKINEKLLHWRMNPGSLLELLSKVNEFTSNLRATNLTESFSKNEIDGLIKMLGNLVFSAKTKDNPLFVKDFVSRIGLMLERDLALGLLRSGQGKPAILADNLKASLLKLSDALTQALQNPAKQDPAAFARLSNLLSYTTDALKTVEARQAVNVIYSQNENGLYLQVPLSDGQTLRQADIFITPDDKNAQNEKKFSSCAIRIFLDMAYLGQLSIEASLREGRIRCVIQCENDEVRKWLEAKSDTLSAALSAIGCGIEKIDCVKTSDLEQKRMAFIEHSILGATELVNSFA